MTTMPTQAALRPEDGGLASPASALSPAVLYGFDEPCSVLIGWKRRDGVLRALSDSHAVVGGVTGIRPGDRVRLVLHGAGPVIRDCVVTRASLQGIELGWAGPDAPLS